MSLTPLPDLILYGRPDCHLCGESREIVTRLLAAREQSGLVAPTLVERNIDTDPAWERAFLETIPVVELAGRRLELATNGEQIRRLLSDVLDA
jgi:hypothetical protein